MLFRDKISVASIKRIYDILEDKTDAPMCPFVIYYPETDQIALESILYDYPDTVLTCDEESFCVYLDEVSGVLSNYEEIDEMVDILFTN